MKLSRVCLAALVAVGVCLARQDAEVCGTHKLKGQEDLALHRVARRQFRTLLRAGSPGLRSSADIGDVAVLSTADGVVARRNPFSLQGRTLRFVPVGTGYRLEVTGSTYDADAAAAGTPLADIGDDDTRRVPLPFTFTFFGGAWNALFVNSDGNLAFGQGDATTTERSLGRMHGGPPRIAPLFRDLDPTESGGSIRVLSDSRRFIVSWSGVREYSDFGNGTRQTFQVRLFPSGIIELAYSDSRTSTAVVGITPGSNIGSARLVTFVNAPPGPYESTVAERFTDEEAIDIFTAAQRFYDTHDDAYDVLVLFNTANIGAGEDALAYQVTIRNANVTGIGDVPADLGAESGSAKRLLSILNMGPLSQYPADPNAVVPLRAISRDTPMTVISHEAGHLWLALASIREEDAPDQYPLLGRGLSHWSFNFNSDASFLEGNRIEDRGAGTSPRFSTVATVEQYSALDRYLMGFQPPSEVPPMFYIRNATSSGARAPQVGVNINGMRRDFTIDDIIAAEGRRSPDHTVSQRRFRFAFVLINPEGEKVDEAALSKVETYRRQFESFFARATGGQAEAETTLRRSLNVSIFPAAGVGVERSIPVTVRLEQRVSYPLTLVVGSRNGVAEAPRMVIVPPGASEASFMLRGVRPGVEEITIETFDRTYERVTARVQVASAGETRLVRLDDEPGFVKLRLTDVNLLPYPGVRVSSNTGASGLTDTDGVVRFNLAGASTVQFTADTGATLTVAAASGSDRP